MRKTASAARDGKFEPLMTSDTSTPSYGLIIAEVTSRERAKYKYNYKL